MSVLHRVDVPDGSLLDIVSGLESVARRFDALVERHAPIDAVPTTGGDDRRTVDLILGVVAVRERLRDVLARASVDPLATNEARDLGIEGSWLR